MHALKTLDHAPGKSLTSLYKPRQDLFDKIVEKVAEKGGRKGLELLIEKARARLRQLPTEVEEVNDER